MSLLVKILPGTTRLTNAISFGVKFVSDFPLGDLENDRITGVK
jgi:hypothetical protein